METETVEPEFEKIIESCFPVGGIPSIGWHQIGQDNQNEFMDAAQYIYKLGQQSKEVAPVEGWISVKDRMPNKHGYYIVSYTGHGGNYVVCVEYSTQSFKFKELHNEITHWQPLPESPKL